MYLIKSWKSLTIGCVLAILGSDRARSFLFRFTLEAALSPVTTDIISGLTQRFLKRERFNLHL